jgi:hypothetical protein
MSFGEEIFGIIVTLAEGIKAKDRLCSEACEGKPERGMNPSKQCGRASVAGRVLERVSLLEHA